MRGAAECEHARAVRRELLQRDARLSARMIAPRAGDECADVAVSLARLGEQHEARGAVGAWRHERHFGADDAADAEFTRRGGEADSAAEVVVIGEREGGHAERVGLRDE